MYLGSPSIITRVDVLLEEELDVAGSRIDVMIQCSKCLSKELTLVLSDTRELNRVPNTK